MLLSDPSVQAMNWEQWLFEALAIKKKEEAEVEYQTTMATGAFEALQKMLISLLGLDAFAPKSENSKLPKVLPLSMIIGHPEVLNALMEAAKKDEGEQSASEDETFEALSSQLHQQLKTGSSDLPGDMVPLLTDENFALDRNAYWNSIDVQQMLGSMGVKQRGSDKSVVHIAAKPKRTDPLADLDPDELARFEEEMRRNG